LSFGSPLIPAVEQLLNERFEGREAVTVASAAPTIRYQIKQQQQQQFNSLLLLLLFEE